MEQLSLKGNTNNYDEYTKSVIQELKKEGLNHMYKLVCCLQYINNYLIQITFLFLLKTFNEQYMCNNMFITFFM